MKAIDTFTPGKSAGLAAALAVANPKNLVLAVGGAVSIAASAASTGGKTAAAVLMVLIASLCTLLPLSVYLLGGRNSAKVLGEWKAWMAAHNTAIMTTVLIILGRPDHPRREVHRRRNQWAGRLNPLTTARGRRS